MPLDPQAKALLDQMAAQPGPAINSLSPADARTVMNLLCESMGPGEPVNRVEDRNIAGPGGEIPIRIYSPAGKPNGIIVFFHGGGWVLGGLPSHEYVCRALANSAGCVVVATDYRLAPEHKFPAAADDSYAATKWAADNAGALGSGANRLVVCGDSAGGNLAAVVSQMARDRGTPEIRAQVLIYPAIDAATDTDSQKRFVEEGQVLSQRTMAWFWNHYLRGREDASNPYACPNKAKDLKRLPPALVITAEYDPLYDEGNDYAAALEKAGNRVKLSRYAGVPHFFVSLAPAIDQGKTAIREIADYVKSALA
jgi:acetyl esterase